MISVHRRWWLLTWLPLPTCLQTSSTKSSASVFYNSTASTCICFFCNNRGFSSHCIIAPLPGARTLAWNIFAPTQHISHRIQRTCLLLIVHMADSVHLYSEILHLEALTCYALLLTHESCWYMAGHCIKLQRDLQCPWALFQMHRWNLHDDAYDEYRDFGICFHWKDAVFTWSRYALVGGALKAIRQSSCVCVSVCLSFLVSMQRLKSKCWKVQCKYKATISRFLIS